MIKFCGDCGTKLKAGICPGCRKAYNFSSDANYILLMQRNKIFTNIHIHIAINCILWGIIAVLQSASAMYLFAIWNVIMCIDNIFMLVSLKKGIHSFIQNQSKSIISILVFCVVNLLLGSFFGFVLNLHMLYIQYYINKNKMLLCFKEGGV